MSEKLMLFFLKNTRLNYVLMFFLIVLGTYSYLNLSKETFPSVDFNVVKIVGSYSGSNPSNLDDFAVTPIENEIKSISGIERTRTEISSGGFAIIVWLKDGVDSANAINKFKDAITSVETDFPDDMDTPVVSLVEVFSKLAEISISSDVHDKEKLIDIADDLKSKITRVEGINKVDIFGKSSFEVKIEIDDDKLIAHNIKRDDFINAVSKLSFIYPIAKIESKDADIFINAPNENIDKEKWLNTLLSVGDKKIYIKDVATVYADYPKDGTISRFNGLSNISMSVNKGKNANIVTAMDEIRSIIETFKNKYKDVNINITMDDTKIVKSRLDTVISSILIGTLLVAISIMVLINFRLSLLIMIGVPIVFLSTAIVFLYYDISLNVISLIAVLVCIGVVVDDAVIVSENIQRKLDEGVEFNKAVLDGAKEMFLPVVVASLTTIFAFLPMAYTLSGGLGLFLKVIPITIAIAVTASLIETFIFLPLHAKHILKPNTKVFNWNPAFNVYEKFLGFLMKFKKTFLLFFIVFSLGGSALLVTKSKFNFLPRTDADTIKTSIIMDDFVKIEKSDEISKEFEELLFSKKDEYYITNVTTRVGYGVSKALGVVNNEYAFYLEIKLKDFGSGNFVERYLTPIFSFNFNFDKEDLRDIKSDVIVKNIKELFADLEKKYPVREINVAVDKHGPVENDIEVLLSSENKEKLADAIDRVKKEIKAIEGTKDVVSDESSSKKDLSFEINSYGQSLGFTDKSLADALGIFFDEKDRMKTTNSEGIVNIYTLFNYDKNIEKLKNFKLYTTDNRVVSFQDIAKITIKDGSDTLTKENFDENRFVYADVDSDVVTAMEVITRITPLLNELESNGVSNKLGGESEENKKLGEELIKAFAISTFLMFIVLLINFPSFRPVMVILSVVPLSVFGILLGHFIMDIKLAMPSFIGFVGLSGVIVNDGIIMLEFLRNSKNKDDILNSARKRLRPIFITSFTTFLGLAILIFYPSAQSLTLQPLAVSLGFGLLWGTIVNLLYVPCMYSILMRIK